MFPNPWVILGFVGFLLLSVSGASWLAYHRGADDTMAAVTTQQLAKANKALADTKAASARQAAAAQSHDIHETQVIHDTRTILKTVTIPPDTDPFVPVWVVRLHDRSASRWPSGDPYPGKSDGDASDTRLSQVVAMLAANYEGCEVNRSRLLDIKHLEPVLPALPPPTPDTKPSLIDRIF